METLATSIPPDQAASGEPGERILRIRIRCHIPEDPRGRALVQAAHAQGICGLQRCRVERLCFLRGPLTLSDAQRLAAQLLIDPLTESFAIAEAEPLEEVPDHWIEVTYRPGVTDPAAERLRQAAHRLGFAEIREAAWGFRFLLWGHLDTMDLERLATGLCSNPIVHRFAIDRPVDPPFQAAPSLAPLVAVIPIREASETALEALNRQRRLALDPWELRAVQEHFRRIGRDPTDVELETIAQTWSEHCAHKTFKAWIRYTGPAPGPPNGPTQTIEIDGLLRTFIQGATERVARPWVRSAFVDNAGIIAFDEQWEVAVKVETHNHPSALEPFGGANTGVGGVIRDILGVSARPIANLDVLCFGPLDLPMAAVPPGALHPQRVAEGVVRGIEDYGNKMGIPTVAGAIFYHPGYTANPLVFCGCIGWLPRGAHPQPNAPRPGDAVVVIGGRTGRDGLGGATFSSTGLDDRSAQEARAAVQIGQPILERQITEVILEARDEGLYHAITDCGAGGLSSAVGEMARHLGVQVDLDQVPLKYAGLRPWEIWLSESQERMVLAVPPENLPRLEAICHRHGVEMAVIGRFEATGRLRLLARGQPVADLDLDFLYRGQPRQRLEAHWVPNPPPLPPPVPTPDLSDVLLRLLRHPNIASREEILRRYDHEVQGATAVKPLVGAADHGPSDGVVLVPLEAVREEGPTPGLAVAVGLCPLYGQWDPYGMAWAAVDEAFRNLVAVGANPDRVALLDNFCWGDPKDPVNLGALVRCAQGAHDAAVAYQAPFISGKDSLHNTYRDTEGRQRSIPGTLLITAVGVVPDRRRTVTMDLKAPGDWLYIVGDTRAELAGSHYLEVLAGARPGADRLPQPVPDALHRLRALHRAIAQGLVQACHDCSEGGLGVALAEMALAGRLGATIDLRQVPGADKIPADDVLMFSESLTRFLVEVRPEAAAAFEAQMAGHPVARLGQVTADGFLRVIGREGTVCLALSIAELERAWRGEEAPGGHARCLARPRLAAPALRRRPRVLILCADGTNRAREAAWACAAAGGEPEIVHIRQLRSSERRLMDYAMLVLPGGFSYGDDLGAGTIWALDLRCDLGEDIARFIEDGRLVLGICNGFQALVKAGFLPGWGEEPARRSLTLAPNASGRFECRWVYLRPNPRSPCRFTEGLDGLLYCPVAHGEGRLLARDEVVLEALERQGLIALTYVDPQGRPAGYPFNPNGSQRGIAGLCNPAGNVLGLMPHPEDHIFPWQHPRHHRGESGGLGLLLFQNALRRC